MRVEDPRLQRRRDARSGVADFDANNPPDGTDANANAFLGRIGLLGGILDVEPDRVAKVLDARPNIPAGLYDQQRTTFFGASVPRAYPAQPAAGIVRLTEVRNTFTEAGGATIAVIDTGVATVPELRGRIVASVDFTLRPGSGQADSRGRPGDLHGHGTHVAGIIAAAGRNPHDDTRGMAPAAHIVSLKVLDADGSGYAADVVDAIDWAVEHRGKYRLRVINLSLGGPVTQSWRAWRMAAMAATRSIRASNWPPNSVPRMFRSCGATIQVMWLWLADAGLGSMGKEKVPRKK